MCEPDAQTRRDLIGTSLRLTAAGALAAALVSPADARPVARGTQGRTRVYLLGSQGGQQRTQLTGANTRAGACVLIVVDGVGYAMDAGVGALLRLNEAGFDATVLRHVFVTHHHQDHNADLGNFIGFSWSSGRNGENRPRRLDVWGPPGTNAYVDGYRRSLALNIADQEGPLAQRPRFDAYLQTHELPLRGRILTRPVLVMRDRRVTVRAIRVNHGAMPSLGYRFTTPDLDVAISGDRGTRGDRFVELARGAEVLFHEITDLDVVLPVLRAQGAAKSFLDHQAHDHSPPALVGATATAAAVGRLVLYHLIPGHPGVTDEAWTGMVAPHWSGPLTVGRDLLEL